MWNSEAGTVGRKDILFRKENFPDTNRSETAPGRKEKRKKEKINKFLG